MIFDAGRGLAQNSSSWSGAMVNSTASHQAMVLLRGDGTEALLVLHYI